jgi:uncharacterized protein YbjT (DUF2867 family)
MKVMELNDLAFAIETRQDLIAFIEALRQDLSSDPEGWENVSLDDYLDALAAWLDGPDEVYARFGEAMPLEASWRFVAKMLLAAKVYE